MHWSKAEPQYYRVESNVVDSSVLTMITPFSEELWREMNEVVGYCTQPLLRERPEGTLNNWVADVMKSEAERYSGTQVDFAVNNYGGIRITTLPMGPVTLGRIYEVMPFDNVMVIMQLKGSILKVFLDDMAYNGGWPISKDLRFTITDSLATDITISNIPLDTQRIYKVVMPDYIANGGDERHYLRELPRQTLSYLIRDALITNTRNITASGDSIVVIKDGRIRLAGGND